MITDKFITSWDDGSKFDLRLAELLLKYNIPATFYIPSNTELTIEEIKGLDLRGFKIGGHTTTHPQDLKLLSDRDIFIEIAGNQRWLKQIIGKDITDFCYPRGRYNEVVVDVLKDLYFESARTTVVLNTDYPSDPYRINTTIHVYPDRKEYAGVSWVEVAKRLYNEAMNKQHGFFHLWGHSWEIDKFKLWDELENFFKFVRESKDTQG